MGRFIFDMSDDERNALERHRVRLGLRSHAETLRALIRGEEKAPEVVAEPVRGGVQPQKRGKVEVPKVVTRLKGEWTPPGGRR
jgi:hypothetical protein